MFEYHTVSFDITVPDPMPCWNEGSPGGVDDVAALTHNGAACAAEVGKVFLKFFKPGTQSLIHGSRGSRTVAGVGVDEVEAHRQTRTHVADHNLELFPLQKVLIGL